MDDYQQRAARTDQTGDDPKRSLLVSILGLSGESGDVATAYKKVLRDGEAFTDYESLIGEELGDVLWYAATIAAKHGLSLDDIARQNLRKVHERWRPSEGTAGGRSSYLDERFPRAERLPRRFDVVFREQILGERVEVVLTHKGKRCGNPLTDNSYREDNYRFHDVFHLAYAAQLGWSPVTRKLLDRKRRSDRKVDEVEDGGRAGVIEEGIAAFVFTIAERHKLFDGVTTVDAEVVRLAKRLTAHLEVRRATFRDWELAILEGYRIFRILRAERGGVVTVDLRNKRLSFRKSLRRRRA